MEPKHRNSDMRDHVCSAHDQNRDRRGVNALKKVVVAVLVVGVPKKLDEVSELEGMQA